MVVIVSRVHSDSGIQIVEDLPLRRASAAVWSPDGKRIATLSRLFTHVTIWDVESRRAIHEFDAPLQGCNCLRFTPDGNFIVTPADRHPTEDHHATLILWDAETGERAREIPGPLPDKPAGYNAARLFAISRDGKQLALSAGGVLALYVDQNWTTPVPLELETDHVYENDSATALEFSPDGRQFAVGTAGDRGPGNCGSRLYLFDAATRKIIWKKQLFETEICNIHAVAFSPDGRFIAAGLGPTFRSQRRPDGTWERVVTANPLLILEPPTGDVIRTMPEATEQIWSMSWSPDGATLAATQDDRSIRFWSMNNPDQRPKRLELSGAAMSVSFAPGGLRFVATDEARAIIGEVSGE